MSTTIPAGLIKPEISMEMEPVTAHEKLKVEVLSDKRVQLSNAMAYKFLEMTTFKGERGVIDTHVQMLVDEMRRCRFMSDHVLIATAVLDGVEYRINGQHTCWARTFMPDNYQCVVRVINYKVKDDEQLRMLYSVFDRNRPRASGHLLKVLLAGTEHTAGVSDSLIQALGSAWRFWQYEDQHDRQRHGHHEIARDVAHKAVLFQQVGTFYQAHAREYGHIRRQGVVAAMFATFEALPTKAETFWTVVVTGLGIADEDDSRYRLREFLKNAVVQSSAGPSRGKRNTSAEEVYRMSLAAWNKWRKGEPVKNLRPTSTRVKPA